MACARLVPFLLFLSSVAFSQTLPPADAPLPPVEFDSWKEIGRNDLTVTYTLTFPSALATQYPVNDVVPLRILYPAKAIGKTPVVVLLHYWGAKDLRLENRLAEQLNRRGTAAVIMTLPYHIERTPAGFRSGELAVVPEPEKLVKTMTQSVLDVRRTYDFIQSHPEFDSKKIGVAGTSLGSLVAALAFGTDERAGYGAFALGGGDLAHIFWNSTRVVSQREELRRKGYTEERMRQELQSVEPLTYLSGSEDGRKAFVIGARYDTVIPRQSTEKLIEVLDKPTVLWLETGHYGGIFVQQKLLNEIATFFAAEFDGVSYVVPEKLTAPTIRLGVEYDVSTGLDIGIGLDLWKSDPQGSAFANLLLTPRGAQLFVGKSIDKSVALGVSISQRRTSIGLFWSVVL